MKKIREYVSNLSTVSYVGLLVGTWLICQILAAFLSLTLVTGVAVIGLYAALTIVLFVAQFWFFKGDFSSYGGGCGLLIMLCLDYVTILIVAGLMGIAF